MALPTTRDHLRGVLREVAARGVANQVVLITKCHVPDDVIAADVNSPRRDLDRVPSPFGDGTASARIADEVRKLTVTRSVAAGA